MMIDDSFELPELSGKVMEELLGVRFEPRQNSILENQGIEVDAVILKLKELVPLQLFYLSAGLGFWEELAAEDYSDYVDQSQVLALDAIGEIRGQKIVSAGCKGSIDRGDHCKIIVDLEFGKIELNYDATNKKTLLFFR